MRGSLWLISGAVITKAYLQQSYLLQNSAQLYPVINTANTAIPADLKIIAVSNTSKTPQTLLVLCLIRLPQYAEGISVSNSKTVERAGRTNRDMKTATTEAKRRSKRQLENGKLSLCLKVNIRFPFIFKLLIILFYSCVYL